MANKPTNGWPTPGPQEIPVDDIMSHLYFLTDKEWDSVRCGEDFDYVVIGSSFCALGFTHQALKNNPDAKILIIDRGTYFHPEHFQNLPPAYSKTVGGKSETFHWKITDDTHNGKYINYLHGMNNFFGGRSSFWSAWCPEPTNEEMADWPLAVMKKVKKYFPDAKKLLNVVPANEISSHEPGDKIFGKLQDAVHDALTPAPSNIEAITRVIHAPLAVKADQYRHVDYQKYSASGPLLNLHLEVGEKSPSLRIMIRCLVKRIQEDDGKAISLETDKGNFHLGKAKLILAMGTLPPTTLMLNSFKLPMIGKRLSSHFISAIVARLDPQSASITQLSTTFKEEKGKLSMGAVYVAGEDPNTKHQFHIQITAIIDETPKANIYDTMRHLPDVMAAPTMEQLLSSKGHVLVVCACLGQIDHNNPRNWFRLNEDEDITCNATLQVVANENDNALWNVMDESTFKILENYLPTNQKIEYWNPDTSKWQNARPTPEQIRVPGLVHESSTMWIGESESAPVDLDYKFRGVENVYLTGGALWPTGASWNPTCVMTGLAMDLADKLTKANN